jgi:MFS family permease
MHHGAPARGRSPASSLVGLRPSSSTFLSLYLPAYILAVGVSIVLPALPLYAKSFEVNFGMASLVVIVNQIGGTASTIPTGYLIDRFGAKRLILAGPVTMAVAALLMANAHSFPELLAYRFVEGWGLQVWQLARMDTIIERGGSRRGSQITGMFALDAAGRLTGPAIGGFVAGAWGLRAPFLLYAVMALLAILPSLWLLPHARAGHAAGLDAGRGWGTRTALQHLMTAPILVLLAAQLLAFMTRGALFGGTLDLYAVYAYQVGPQTLGFLALAGGLLSFPLTFFSGRVMDRFGRGVTIVPGFCLLAVSLVVMATSAFGRWPFSSYVGAFLFARLAGGTVSGSMAVLGSDMAPQQARGVFLGVSTFVRQTGGFLSPAIFALVSGASGYGPGFAVLSALSLATAALTAKQLAMIKPAERLAHVPPAGAAEPALAQARR